MLQTPQRSKTQAGAAYASWGQGEPIVLVHGVGMRLEAWTPQIEALSDRWRVIAVDLPGHGESAPLATDAPLEAFVSWFAGLLEDLDLGSASVAGHSMGALIAGGIVIERPDLVKRAALLNGVHKRDAMARDAVLARAQEIMTGAFDREAPLGRWFGAGHEHEAAYLLSKRLLADVDKQGYATAYGAFAGGDRIYADRWTEVQRPALFLTGDGDLNSTAAMARQMSQLAPHGRAIVIEGHRHMVNLTAPDRVNAALADWMTWGDQDHNKEVGHEH